jgi:hypothetical protein
LDLVGVCVSTDEQQSFAAIRQRKGYGLTMIGGLRLHSDLQAFADGLIEILQPQVRRELGGAELQAELRGTPMDVGK